MPDAPSSTWPWFDPFVPSCPGLAYMAMPSQRLGQDYGLAVYRPVGNDRPLPVLWFLLGRNGRQALFDRIALRLDAEIQAGRMPACLAVCPNSLGQSLYCNRRDGTAPVEDLIIREAVPWIDAAFPTLADRRHRVISGFSMGAFGAMRLGLRHSHLFGGIAALSGAYYDAGSIAAHRPELFAEVFCQDQAYARRELVWDLIDAHAHRLRGHTAIRLGVGAVDELAERNRLLHHRLVEAGVSHDYAEIPDASHTFWAVVEGYPGGWCRWFTDLWEP